MTGDDSWTRLRKDGALAGLDVGRVVAVEPILGHASRRSFYRLREATGSSRILVVYPEGRQDEVDRYVRTRAWLQAAGLPVPEIEARGRRALLVEDGGDRLLADWPTGRAARLRCYRQAVEHLARLQRHGRREAAPNPDWALDRDRLRKELAFTEEHALQGWLGASRGAAARERGFDRIVELAARVPTVLCHRDYHARNLLVRRGRLLVLDFQDLMRGPWPYDLASLLWDNYCDLDHGAVSELTARFRRVARPRRGDRTGNGAEAAGGTGAPGIPPGLAPQERREFCVVGLQRSLKALGTFGYQVHVAGNAAYGRYAPRTWGHARRALRALGWDDLEAALAPLESLGEAGDGGPLSP